MRTTVTIDDELLQTALEYADVKEVPALIRKALETYVYVEAGRRLARMGGTVGQLRFAVPADDNEVINLIVSKGLPGSGIGYVGAHLLASCLLTTRTYLWTRDRRLAAVAARLGTDATAG